MNKDKAMEWVAKLRSGESKQGKHYLHQKDGSMCCLGVLCSMSGVEPRMEDGVYAYFGFTGTVPYNIRDMFELSSCDGTRRDGKPIIINGVEYPCLAQANDSGDVSFAEIADYIEQNWEAL